MADSILKGKRILIVDQGISLHWVYTLMEFGAIVSYYMPWVSAYPKSNKLIVGSGIKGVTRLRDWEDIEDEFDLFIFTDVYFGAVQERLRKAGKRVWGSGKGEDLELMRWEAKKLLKAVGLPVQNVARIIGVPSLREYLKKHEDVHVKISTTRGEFESFHSENYKLIEPKIDAIEHKLGAKKHIQEFIVEDSIESVCEVGWDGYIIDGQIPDKAVMGFEIKDCGLLGTVMDYGDFPQQLKDVNEKLAPTFNAYQYRGDFSSEVRIDKKGVGYFIDSTNRKPCPPNEILSKLYSNWDDIYWYGAEGILVNPEPVKKYGMQAVMISDHAEDDWQAIYIEPEVREWVMLMNHCIIKGVDYIVPQEVHQKECGYVVGIGDTIKEAYEHLRKNVEGVKGYGIHIDTDSMVKALDEVRKAQSAGIFFTDDRLPDLLGQK